MISNGFALGKDEGGAFWFLGTLMTVKCRGDDSNGGLTIVEQLAPEGFAPPRHVHHQDDEAFYLLEGEMRVFCGDNEWSTGAGGFVFLPREVPHAFVISRGPSRILQITAPSGFEAFMAALSEPATARHLPPGQPDMDALMAQLPNWSHYVDMVGPPPGPG